MALVAEFSVFELRVSLRDVEPEVWRQMLVSGSLSLARLHSVLQETMGWSDRHLHSFEIDGNDYGVPDDDSDEELLPEAEFNAAMVLKRGDRFVYEYDFGDGWIHDIEVVAIHTSTSNLKFPTVLAGENACPPEDCGGPRGYLKLRSALQDSGDFVSAGGKPDVIEFKPRAFSIANVNAALQHLR